MKVLSKLTVQKVYQRFSFEEDIKQKLNNNYQPCCKTIYFIICNSFKTHYRKGYLISNYLLHGINNLWHGINTIIESMKYNRSLFFFSIIFCNSLIIPLFTKAQKPLDHDTTYYVTYPGTLVGRFYFSKKYASFTLPAANDGQDLEYKANTLRTMGIGATYNNLTINLAYGFSFLNNDDDKGKTKSIDLQAHLFPHKWALDLLAIRHEGLSFEPKTDDDSDNNYYRPDIQQLFIGFSGYRVFNPQRFSFNAAMTQNEWQKKSAGSLLLGGLVYYGQIKGDSSLIPKQDENYFPKAAGINKVNFFSIGVGGGYAYTVVIAKHFYITGSGIVNLNADFSTVQDMNDKANKTTLKPTAIYKAAVGYNSDSWDISATWAASDIWVKGDYFSNDFSIPTGNYRLIFSKKIALKKH